MNKGNFQIGSIRGIPIRIHFTFLLVLPLLALAFARVFTEAARVADVPSGQLGQPLLWGLGIALALFVSVLLHELAHSLYALRKGGQVKDITLMMVGGVSQISEMPREPKHEAIMAFAGPLVSLVLGGLLYGVHLAIAETPSFQLRFGLFYLGALNLFLGVFNLLPAFPMDGGRILRALLCRRLGMVRATQIAATVGKLFAVAFGIWGIASMNLLLVLIAVFVYAGADSERRAVLVKEMIGDLRVRDLMTPYAFSVPADMSVYEAGERMLRERRLAFAATREGKAVGQITLEGVQSVPPERRASTPVRDIAIAAPTVSPDDTVSAALKLMNETNAPQLAVTFGGDVIGSIGREEILRGVRLGELQATQPHHRDLAEWTAHAPPPPGSSSSSYPPRGTWRGGGDGRGHDIR